MYYQHREFHRIEHIGWLRAAVLGANDGIISTASLLIGIASAHSHYNELLIAGIAALIAGAMSMAAGEYISVSSQADSENAEIQREKLELEKNLPAEEEELTNIYIQYGLQRNLANQVAKELMAKDALSTHMREELGITHALRAKPLQAAIFSAASFAIGSALPILVTLITPFKFFVVIMFITAIVFLAILGALAAKAGGATIIRGTVRVLLWGTLAMVCTAIIGHLLGTHV